MEKKWFACGDSFTAGDMTGYVDAEGHSGMSSDAFDGTIGCYKTYPYWIQKRTGIIADWRTCARSGNDFTNVEGAVRPFSNSSSSENYTMIPADADYITLMFGLNEYTITTEQIGQAGDTTNETLWGAYKVVINSILTNNPRAKIGIIISDSWMCDPYHEELIKIAKYFGIPYLDLKNGEQVPMGTRGRLENVDEDTKNLRTNGFIVSSTNAHPSVEGHEYRSTFIENFLRSL